MSKTIRRRPRPAHLRHAPEPVNKIEQYLSGEMGLCVGCGDEVHKDRRLCHTCAARQIPWDQED